MTDDDWTELREALDKVRRQAALAPLTYSPGYEPQVIRDAMELAYEAAPSLLARIDQLSEDAP